MPFRVGKEVCPTCKGEGVIRVPSAKEGEPTTRLCPECGGEGYVTVLRRARWFGRSLGRIGLHRFRLPFHPRLHGGGRLSRPGILLPHPQSIKPSGDIPGPPPPLADEVVMPPWVPPKRKKKRRRKKRPEELPTVEEEPLAQPDWVAETRFNIDGPGGAHLVVETPEEPVLEPNASLEIPLGNVWEPPEGSLEPPEMPLEQEPLVGPDVPAVVDPSASVEPDAGFQAKYPGSDIQSEIIPPVDLYFEDPLDPGGLGIAPYPF